MNTPLRRKEEQLNIFAALTFHFLNLIFLPPVRDRYSITDTLYNRLNVLQCPIISAFNHDLFAYGLSGVKVRWRATGKSKVNESIAAPIERYGAFAQDLKQPENWPQQTKQSSNNIVQNTNIVQNSSKITPP